MADAEHTTTVRLTRPNHKALSHLRTETGESIQSLVNRVVGDYIEEAGKEYPYILTKET